SPRSPLGVNERLLALALRPKLQLGSTTWKAAHDFLASSIPNLGAAFVLSDHGSDFEAENIARRLKLILLSDELRFALKKLPLVLLVGPTQSGKTTLRENLLPNPNSDLYGGLNEHRTAVPKIVMTTIGSK